jgi:hypothetical protein
MKAADIAVVVKEASGNWAAKDYYSTDYVTPVLDSQQDLKLISTQVCPPTLPTLPTLPCCRQPGRCLAGRCRRRWRPPKLRSPAMR